MNIFRTKLTLLAVIPVVALSLVAAKANAAPAPRQISLSLGLGQDRPWDAPPQEFDELNRRAFHDGIEAARWDFQNRRPPNMNRSGNFRHPPVPRRLRDQYRAGFSRGYQAAQEHMRHDQPGRDHDRDRWPR